jgi:hypothetical protein
LKTLHRDLEDPVIFREDCSIDYDSESWTRWPDSGGSVNNSKESMATRHSRMVPQIRCALKLPGGTFRVNEEIKSLNVLMAGSAGEITKMSPDELGASVTAEEEPFVYLIDVFPLRRADVNIFGTPADKDGD